MSVVAITNPASRRNRRRGHGLDAAFAARPECRHHVLEVFADLPTRLDEAIVDRADAIVLNGGDGTVQAALTHLLSHHAPATIPPLLLLPGGTTNAIAARLGPRGGRRRVLREFLRRSLDANLGAATVTAPVLRVDLGPRRAPQFGMLLGAAGITRGVRYRRALLPQPWLPDAIGASFAILKLALGAWRGSASAAAVLSGETIAIEIDERERLQGRFAIILATTLDRIVLGACPFWGEGPGAVRFTSIAHPIPGLLANLPALLYGGARRSLPEAYQSRNAATVTLSLASPVTLDGEFLEPDPAVPVRISSAGPVRFLRW